MIALVFSALLLQQADTAAIDRFIAAEMQRQKIPGLSLAVLRGDTVLVSRGYGFANVELKVPNTSATKFRIGSVTKQFTAAAILLLEERGKLSVQDPVAKFIPDAPAAWAKMTINALMAQ